MEKWSQTLPLRRPNIECTKRFGSFLTLAFTTTNCKMAQNIPERKDLAVYFT
eukprot:UN27224